MSDLHASAIGADVPRDFVLVHGPDAVSWLQGQLSQDIAALEVGGSAWSFILQPQGKVDALVRVTRTADDAVVLDVDHGWGEAVIARLNRFKLRVKADVSSLDWRCVAVRGVAEVPPGPGELVVVPAWLPGLDLIGDEVAHPEGIEMVDPGRFELLRIKAGFPKMGAELDASTIPGETGLVAHSVSFTKGCFTGQELVARIDSRGGNVPRHLRSLALTGEGTLPPVGAEVIVDGAVVGAVTSAAGQGLESMALAYIKRAVIPPVPCEVVWAGSQRSATVLGEAQTP